LTTREVKRLAAGQFATIDCLVELPLTCHSEK